MMHCDIHNRNFVRKFNFFSLIFFFFCKTVLPSLAISELFFLPTLIFTLQQFHFFSCIKFIVFVLQARVSLYNNASPYCTVCLWCIYVQQYVSYCFIGRLLSSKRQQQQCRTYTGSTINIRVQVWPATADIELRITKFIVW